MYGIKIWLVMDAMMMVLEGFHHKISIHIVEMTDINRESREWEWDSVEAALKVACIWPIRKYVRSWQTTIAKYIAAIPIYKLCIGEERMEGSSRLLRWWYQEHPPQTGK